MKNDRWLKSKANVLIITEGIQIFCCYLNSRHIWLNLAAKDIHAQDGSWGVPNASDFLGLDRRLQNGVLLDYKCKRSNDSDTTYIA
jgi:hypothetical protein